MLALRRKFNVDVHQLAYVVGRIDSNSSIKTVVAHGELDFDCFIESLWGIFIGWNTLAYSYPTLLSVSPAQLQFSRRNVNFSKCWIHFLGNADSKTGFANNQKDKKNDSQYQFQRANHGANDSQHLSLIHI